MITNFTYVPAWLVSVAKYKGISTSEAVSQLTPTDKLRLDISQRVLRLVSQYWNINNPVRGPLLTIPASESDEFWANVLDVREKDLETLLEDPKVSKVVYFIERMVISKSGYVGGFGEITLAKEPRPLGEVLKDLVNHIATNAGEDQVLGTNLLVTYVNQINKTPLIEPVTDTQV